MPRSIYLPDGRVLQMPDAEGTPPPVDQHIQAPSAFVALKQVLAQTHSPQDIINIPALVVAKLVNEYQELEGELKKARQTTKPRPRRRK